MSTLIYLVLITYGFGTELRFSDRRMGSVIIESTKAYKHSIYHDYKSIMKIKQFVCRDNVKNSLIDDIIQLLRNVIIQQEPSAKWLRM